MRAAWVVPLLVALAFAAEAGDAPLLPLQQQRGNVRTDLFIELPLDHHSTDVVFPFGGTHHAVPGVVAVNRAPYYCAPHARAFRGRAAFVAHLRRRHGLEDRDIPARVLVDGGQVRYLGD